MKKIIISLCIGIGFVGSASAANLANTMKTTTTMNSFCVHSATDINFGEIQPAASGFSFSNGSFTVRCSNRKSFSALLNGGSNSIPAHGGDNGIAIHLVRLMKSQSSNDTLEYDIAPNTNFSNQFGDKTYAALDGYNFAPINSIGNGTEQIFTMYGRVRLTQHPRVDYYSDTLLLTIQY